MVLPDGSRPQLPRYGKLTLTNPRFIVESGGGGGFGDPFERPPADVLLDVAGEIVSRSAAEQVYGVVITQEGTVDEAATRTRRAQRS